MAGSRSPKSKDASSTEAWETHEFWVETEQQKHEAAEARLRAFRKKPDQHSFQSTSSVSIEVDEVASWFIGKSKSGPIPDWEVLAVLASLWEQERVGEMLAEPSASEPPRAGAAKIYFALKLLHAEVPTALAAEQERRKTVPFDLIEDQGLLRTWLTECDRLLNALPLDYVAATAFRELVPTTWKKRLPWHRLAIRIAQRAAEAWKAAEMGGMGYSVDARFTKLVWAAAVRVDRGRSKKITLGALAKVLERNEAVWTADGNSPFRPVVPLLDLVKHATG